MSGRAVPAEGVRAGMRVRRVDVTFLWQLFRPSFDIFTVVSFGGYRPTLVTAGSFAQALTCLLWCRWVVTARRLFTAALVAG